jgi:hypothetical protein
MRPLTHISKKIAKVRPTLTDTNTSTTVHIILWIILVVTSLPHKRPSHVRRRLRIVRGMTMFYHRQFVCQTKQEVKRREAEAKVYRGASA